MDKIFGFHLVIKNNKGKDTWYAWRSVEGKQRWVYIGGDASCTVEEIAPRGMAKIKAWCEKHNLGELLRDTPYTIEDSLEERLRHLEEQGERQEKRIEELTQEVTSLRGIVGGIKEQRTQSKTPPRLRNSPSLVRSRFTVPGDRRFASVRNRGTVLSQTSGPARCTERPGSKRIH